MRSSRPITLLYYLSVSLPADHRPLNTSMTYNTSILSRRRFLARAGGARRDAGRAMVYPRPRAWAATAACRPASGSRWASSASAAAVPYVLGFMLDVPGVQCLSVCDVRATRRQAVKAQVDKKYGNRDCTTYRDFRELLARGNIDTVLIATGDRWHAAAACLAAKAGKDIYCEKPCSMSIHQAAALAETVRRYGRIFQVGTQRRNVGNFQCAVELARSGKLGKLQAVHASIYAPAENHNWLPAEPEAAAGRDRLGPLARSRPVAALQPPLRRRRLVGQGRFRRRGGLLGWGRTPSICANGPPGPTAPHRWSSSRPPRASSPPAMPTA